MVISITHHLSLSRPSAPSVPTPDYHKTHCIYSHLLRLFNVLVWSLLLSIFADLSGPGSKVALHSPMAVGGAVAMREALSRYLCFCFLHLLAGFAVRLTTTHPFESIK